MKPNIFQSKSNICTSSNADKEDTETGLFEKEELSEKNPLVRIQSTENSLYTATNPLMVCNTNSDIVDSAKTNLYRVKAVSHYSYNLSPFQQSWTTTKRTNFEEKNHKTTSFIELPEEIRPEFTVKNDINLKNHMLPEDNIKTFYENADVLNTLDSKFDSLETRNQCNSLNGVLQNSQDYKLLLVGGNINESNFHKKESLHMWECDLKYN